MAKRKTAAKRGPMQQMIDRQANDEATAPLVNAFAERQGDYDRNLRFVSNRGGTALDRWRNQKTISDSQMAAILHCQRLWAKLRSPRVVVDFDRQPGDGDNADWLVRQMDALNELHRIAAPFGEFWGVFENVCRHDLPAGVAGSRLANTKRSAEVAARMIVCMVADMIATRERLSF